MKRKEREKEMKEEKKCVTSVLLLVCLVNLCSVLLSRIVFCKTREGRFGWD